MNLTPPPGVGQPTGGTGGAGGDAAANGGAGADGSAGGGGALLDMAGGPDRGPPEDAPEAAAGDAEGVEGGGNEDPLANGRPCTHGGQCDSGFCVDRVCCASECTGLCASCQVPGSEGTCRPVPAGEDPREQCADTPAATCGQDGTCDGAGVCRLYPAGRECAPGSCTGAVEQAASTCDGAGTCRPGGSRSCSSGSCQGGACGATCGSDTDCLTGFYCESTACLPRRPQGTACGRAGECATGNCVHGYCCNSPCAQTCHACDVSGSAGTCTPVPAGTDPKDHCPSSEASTCGTSGQCNGSGGCTLYPAGTLCGRAASCSDGVETGARTCNGLGTCLASTTRDCSPYLCDATSCATTCTSAAQCQPGHDCAGSSCVPTTPVDGGADPGALLLDDFSDTNLRSNTFGGVVTWDNATATLVAGEQKFVWSGSGSFHDFIETFRSNWCEFDLSGYTRLRFRMRASTANKRVEIILGIGNGSCGRAFDNRVSTVTLGTTMTAYDIDISRTTRHSVRTVEFAPTTTDTTEYFLDDIVLAP